MVDRTKHSQTKRRIAERAVELCSDGDSIIINGGSSTYMMGEFLPNVDVSVLTNSFVLANDITENSDNQVTLPGGEIYREQGIILSSYENDCTEYYYGSMMFMGTPLITDSKASDKAIKFFEDNDIQVIVVEAVDE